MKKIIILLTVLLTSCTSKVTNLKRTLPQNKSQLGSQNQIESNSTIMGIDPSSVNIFNPNYFSPVEVFGILILIIVLLCFGSLLPNIKKYIKKKRS